MTRRRGVVYWTGFSVILALLIVAPLVLPEFWRRFVTEILIWGLLAMSSDILIGYAGMISFGHSALFGLGIYGAAGSSVGADRPISGWRSCTGWSRPPESPPSWLFLDACATSTPRSRP